MSPWRRRLVLLAGVLGLVAAINQPVPPAVAAPAGGTGTFLSIGASNVEGAFVRHAYGMGLISTVTAGSPELDKADATWAFVPGLAGICLSLESRNYRGFFLRHYAGRVYLQPKEDSYAFREDATFCKIPGLAGSDGEQSFSLRALQYLNSFLRHAYGEMRLDENDGSTLFKQDATFLRKPPWLTGKFFNPVLDSGADPSMVHHNGNYYLVQGDTYNDNNIVIRRAASVEGLAAAKPIVVWRHAPCVALVCGEVWAPELQRINGQWWIYFTAYDGTGGASHRVFALRGTTDDPAGPYQFQGMVDLPGAEWAIDGVYLQYQGNDYLLWSGWQDGNGKVQHLFISRMADPMTPVGDRVRISSPTAGWETVPNGLGVLVNEAPQPIIGPNGRLYVAYSANGSWTDDYCLGLLSLNGDPLDPAAWSKSAGCVFSGQETATAPGHNGFLTVGGRPWLAYHALVHPGSGWGGRSIRLQPMSFHPDGSPAFGVPVNIHQGVPLP